MTTSGVFASTSYIYTRMPDIPFAHLLMDREHRPASTGATFSVHNPPSSRPQPRHPRRTAVQPSKPHKERSPPGTLGGHRIHSASEYSSSCGGDAPVRGMAEDGCRRDASGVGDTTRTIGSVNINGSTFHVEDELGLTGLGYKLL